MNGAAGNASEPNLLYASLFGCIITVGLPLNAVALWILLRRHSIESSNAVFMVNLAVSDLLLVTSLPMRVYFFATGSWPLSKVACQVTMTLFRDNIRSSGIFITFISVDRLLAVVYPLRSRCLRTACNAWKAVALAWLLVLAVNIPERSYLVRHLSNGTCFEHVNSESARRGAVFYVQPVLVSILLIVNIVCTGMVFRTLRRHLGDSALVHNKVNVMLIFALNLVVFTICFVPVSVGVFTLPESDLRPLGCLSAANCCLDPLLYYFSFDGFWKKKENDVPLRQQ